MESLEDFTQEPQKSPPKESQDKDPFLEVLASVPDTQKPAQISQHHSTGQSPLPSESESEEIDQAVAAVS